MKLFLILLISFVMAGCASIERVATGTAKTQCALSPDVRLAERKAYFEANGQERILVGFCRGEDGFESAKAEYIDRPSRLLELINSAAAGEYEKTTAELVKKLVEYQVEKNSITFDENGCYNLPKNQGSWCPPE